MLDAGSLTTYSSMVDSSREVSSKRTRRRFSVAEKLQIVLESEACSERGAIGALLRRRGLYASQLAEWRQAYARGELSGTGKRRGPAAKVVAPVVNPSAARIAQLERELARATARAERAELLVDAQKKFSELLGLALPTADLPIVPR